MNLYIFEPYKWPHCRGAIGVVAENFEKAVNLIINSKYNQDGDSFQIEHFQRTPENLKEDMWDQWLLTHDIPVSPDRQPGVLFSNWNYS